MNLDLSYVEEFKNTTSIEDGSLYTADESGENPIGESVFYDVPANSNVVDVENDFNGDLASAIASANSGDTVQLGNKVYYTDGIVIDKNIVLSGVEGSVIDPKLLS